MTRGLGSQPSSLQQQHPGYADGVNHVRGLQGKSQANGFGTMSPMHLGSFHEYVVEVMVGCVFRVSILKKKPSHSKIIFIAIIHLTR
jgi:hypothetical protein